MDNLPVERDPTDEEIDESRLPSHIRDARGRFVKGVVANPAGRGKGTRNWIVEQKMAFEAALRDYVAEPRQARKFLDAIDNLVDIAANPDKNYEAKDSVGAMKILTDHFLNSTGREAEQDSRSKPPSAVRIIIETDAPVKAVAVVEQEPVDAEYVEQAAPSDGSSGSRELVPGDSSVGG